MVFFGCCPGRAGAALPEGELVFDDLDRVLVLAAHPGDEILGCAGVIQEARERHLPLRIVFLTQGDSGEAFSAMISGPARGVSFRGILVVPAGVDLRSFMADRGIIRGRVWRENIRLWRNILPGLPPGAYGA